MKSITSKSIAASLSNPADGPARAAVRVSGEGTESNPLRFAAVLRHADMADESSAAKRTSQTEDCIERLNRELDEVVKLRPANLNVSRLKHILVTSNEAAKPMETYYSAIVGVRIGERMALAGIGHVAAWLFSQGECRTLITPTIMPIDNETSGPRVLTSALGVGFRPEGIQQSETRLEPKDFAAIAFQADLATESLGRENFENATQILDRLTENFSRNPAVLIVVTS